MDWNILLCCTSTTGAVEAATLGVVNWNIVLSTFVGALFGAICSYPIILWSNNSLKKSAVKKLTTRIKDEIKTNRNTLDKVKDDPTQIWIFSSPLWEIVPSDLLLYFEQNDYTKIVTIYAAVKQLNRLESSIDVIDEDNAKKITEKRKETLEIIDKNII